MLAGLTDTISNEKIKPPITANHRWMNDSRIRGEFQGSYLKQDKLTFTPRNVVNLFIVYKLDTWS